MCVFRVSICMCFKVIIINHFNYFITDVRLEGTMVKGDCVGGFLNSACQYCYWGGEIAMSLCRPARHFNSLALKCLRKMRIVVWAQKHKRVHVALIPHVANLASSP